jgi:AcrR family transcriptional regulator
MLGRVMARAKDPKGSPRGHGAADRDVNGSGKNGGRATPRGGREAVVARVLDAAEDLFASQPYADVSVRQIADAAGVSHALVHRYAGSKADLLRTVLERHEGMFTEAAGDATTARQAAALMLGGDMRLIQRYFRLVLRVNLDGALRETAGLQFPATRMLARLAAGQPSAGAEPDVDPRLAVAAVVSLVVGFAALRDALLAEIGLQDIEPAVLDGQLRRIVDLALRATIPEPPGDG